MTRFDPTLYSQFRPLYPEKIFSSIKSTFRPDFSVIDLGAGTGLSSLSFLEIFPTAKITLIEPDSKMLAIAQENFNKFEGQLNWIVSAAETLSLPRQSVDLILVGSAWHWMDALKTLPRLHHALKPGGIVHIFEYQFPKSLSSDSLNEWVRRQFNLKWKAPAQAPRGKLKELVAPFLKSNQFELISEIKFDQQVEYNLEQYLGLIFSQSRFIHFLDSLKKENRSSYCEEVKTGISDCFRSTERHSFFYRMQAFSFRAL